MSSGQILKNETMCTKESPQLKVRHRNRIFPAGSEKIIALWANLQCEAAQMIGGMIFNTDPAPKGHKEHHARMRPFHFFTAGICGLSGFTISRRSSEAESNIVCLVAVKTEESGQLLACDGIALCFGNNWLCLGTWRSISPKSGHVKVQAEDHHDHRCPFWLFW